MNIGNIGSRFSDIANSIQNNRATGTSEAEFDPQNNPRDAQILAARYAPILVLPEGKDDDLPANPQEFIDNSTLKKEDRFRDTVLGDNTDANQGPGFNGSDLANPESDKLYLDLDDDKRFDLGKDQSDPAQLNYETDFTTNPPTITYHIFYAYNDGPRFQNHEGDWERITLELDPETLEPKTALYNAHHHVNHAEYRKVRDPDTGRPIVYVASGAHAGHADAGESKKKTEFPFFDEYIVANPDKKPIRELEGAVIYEDWGDIVDVTQQDFYTSEPGNDGVRWGQDGHTSFTGGVTGPSFEKGALENPKSKEQETSSSHDSNDGFNPFDWVLPVTPRFPR